MSKYKEEYVRMGMILLKNLLVPKFGDVSLMQWLNNRSRVFEGTIFRRTVQSNELLLW